MNLLNNNAYERVCTPAALLKCNRKRYFFVAIILKAPVINTGKPFLIGVTQVDF